MFSYWQFLGRTPSNPDLNRGVCTICAGYQAWLKLYTYYDEAGSVEKLVLCDRCKEPTDKITFAEFTKHAQAATKHLAHEGEKK
ncbi:MAG: hypothetical protein AAB552_00805 [Patescibacteria group bacterium]